MLGDLPGGRMTSATVAVAIEEENDLVYEPTPIDTSSVQLDGGIIEPTERLAENTHDFWARQRFAEGWCYGPERDGPDKSILVWSRTETFRNPTRNTTVTRLERRSKPCLS